MKILQFILGFVFSTIITIVFFEFFFRFSEVFLPSCVDGKGNFKSNAKISLQTESYNMVQVNKYGYLGTAYPPLKKDSLLRIALVGDSFVEGLQVREEFHFRSIMESELKQNFQNENIQILNFGKSGFNFASMFVYSKLFIQQFNPDIIVYFIQEGDFFYKLKDIEKFNKLNEQNFTVPVLESNKDKIVEYMRNFAYWNFLKSVVSSINSVRFNHAVFDKFAFLFENSGTNSSSVKKTLYDVDRNTTNKIINELKKNSQTIIIPIRKINNHEISDLINKFDVIELDNVYCSFTKQKINPFYWEATKIDGHWNQSAHLEIGKYIASHKAITEKVKFILRNKR